MNKLIITSLAVFFSTACLYAQVGIATQAPTAQLELANDVLAPNFPLLELNPQATPAGTATGQLAVVGDQLFMYDAARVKWLSTETTALQFSNSGATSNQLLKYGEVANVNSGAYMPLNGTIVYVGATTADLSGGGSIKAFDVTVKNGTTTVSTTTFNLVNWKFFKTDYNVNFSAGNYINVRTPAAGGNVTDPTVTVWVKWRK